MASRTRIMKIGALLLSQFGLLAALKFKLFCVITAYNDDGTEKKPVFGFIFLRQKDVLAQKENISSSWPSLWLP